MRNGKVIVISGAEPGLPYSKGLRASELMVTGLSPYRAYQVAEHVEERLRERRVASVTSEELDDLTIDVLTDVAGERYATNFLRWRGGRVPGADGGRGRGGPSPDGAGGRGGDQRGHRRRPRGPGILRPGPLRGKSSGRPRCSNGRRGGLAPQPLLGALGRPRHPPL